MSLAEIVAVDLATESSESLIGWHIESPRPGSTVSSHGVEIWGWVVGRHSRVLAVEISNGTGVQRRAPVDVRRDDVAKGFPNAPGAGDSGFRDRAVLLGQDGHVELRLDAVLAGRRRVPLGTIRARRFWPDIDDGAGGELVSVVIPCYNQAHLLGAAIESVLAQSHPRIEVVVVDDGSSDNTVQVAARYPDVRCVSQPNQGVAAARNTGIRSSNGNFIAFLDADDRLLPQALATGLRHLRQHPEQAFVSGRAAFIGADGRRLPEEQPLFEGRDHYLELLRDCYIWMGATVLYRRAMFQSVGLFDPRMHGCDDYDLYLRTARSSPIGRHEEIIAEYRLHGSNVTRSNPGLMLRQRSAVHRSHWAHAKRLGAPYMEACREGLAFSRREYGEPLVSQVRGHVRAAEWRAAMQGLWLLLRWYPRGFVGVVRRPI